VRVRVRDGAAACSVESVELEPEQSHE
jgi:hypothetical protein